MSEKFSPRRVVTQLVVAGAGLAALTGCSQFEGHIPDCDPGVETVTVDEARAAYNNPDATLEHGSLESMSPNRKFAKDLSEMDCRNTDGNQVVIRSLAEERGGVFPSNTETGD